jgi:fibronectin-binding autotransporter adhesin
MKPVYYCIISLLISVWCFNTYAQSTSWKGTSNTSWSNSGNWTNGIPDATKDVVIGDASFTGSFQPTISSTATAKSITVGGTTTSTLTISKGLTVAGNFVINANGTVIQNGYTVSLTGNWTKAGTYTANSTNAKVIFSGTSQSINASGSTLTFRKLTINTGSTVTAGVAFAVSNSGSILTVSGTFDPSSFQISGTGGLTVKDNAVLHVRASTFTGSYSLSGSITLSAGNTVNYSATGDQTVSNSFTYSTLRISGSGTKSLTGNLPALRSASATQGNIYVDAGTFDLSSFTANRGNSATGGTFSVANNATLKIGGTNTFPSNYNTHSLALAGTTEYSGTSQTVSLESYGNLTLSSSSGSVTKTMPSGAMVVTGNLTSNPGSGSVSFTAGAAITVTGNLTIGTGTTFDAASFSHTVFGNISISGTLTGNTSTISLTGPSALISGSGTCNFNNLTITASGITSTVSALNIAGNLSTTGSGAFTHTPSGTVTMSGSSKSISGNSIVFDNLTLSGSISTSSSFTVTGNLSVAGSLSASSGTITMSGTSKTISGSGTKSFSALTISGSVTTTVNFSISSALNVSGTFSSSSASVATFTGSSTLNGTASLYNVTLNGTELKLSTNAVLGIANVLTISAGTLNVTSTTPNTVSFNGSGAQNVNGITYNNLILSGGNTKTALAGITLNGDLSVVSGTTFSGSTFTHSIYGNWINAGSYTPSSGTVQFLGAGNSTITGATTFNVLTINKSSSSEGVTLNNNVSTPTLNMTNGWLATGSNSITITTARSGSGLIYGNIVRTHSFSASTAYEFEGPQNTLTFSASNSVTSVMVSVTQGAITDFPFNGSISRVYTVSVTGSMGAATATLRLHYNESELNGNTESTMELWRYNGASWAQSGKTGGNTASDYVEQSGIASSDLATRWTLSDNANVAQWSGGFSNQWSDAANWVVIEGSPSLPPSASDIAEIGNTAFLNHPTISGTAESVKNIVFGAVQPVILTINGGGTLTTGAISGQWGAGLTHTINVGDETLTVNGNMLLSDGVSGHVIDLNVNAGTVTVTGSITQSGGANITFTDAGNLNVGGNFMYTSGVFTPGPGTVTYNGTLLQTIAGITYNNLTINKSSGIATKNNTGTIVGNVTVAAGELDINIATTISGNVSIASGATINGDGVTTSVAGNWTNNGTFISASGTIEFNGTGAQQVSASTFNNFTVNKSSGTLTLNGNISVNGNLTIAAGTVSMAGFTANRSLLGGVFSMSNGTSLSLTGSNFPSNYSTYSLGSSSTVTYSGSSVQTVSGVTYGHLVLSNGSGNAKTLSGSVTVGGDLTINSGATLDAGAQTITLSGNWNNSGTFTPSTGTVVFEGTSKTITGNTTFNRMTIRGTYTVSNNDIVINGHFIVVSGGSYAAGSGTHTVNGDLTNSGSLTSTGTTTFTGNTTQTIQLLNAITSNSSGVINFNGTVSPVLNSTSMPTYANLNINNTGGVTASVGWKVLVSFNISSGATFNAGAFNDSISGSFTNNGTVTSSGLMFFNPTSAPVTVALGSGFSSTGTVRFGGTSAVTITGTPAALKDVIISNTNVAGITPPSGWSIGGTFTIRSNAIFNAGSFSYTVAGNLESNGVLNGGTSTFTINSSTAELSGSGSTNFNNMVITGNLVANSDFYVSGNFTNNGTYDGSVSTLIMTGTGSSVISGSTTPSTIAHLSNAKTNATTTLGVNLSAVSDLEIKSGTLSTSTFTISQSTGTLKVEDNATLQVGGTNTLPVFDTYEIDTLSTVEYNGSGTQAIAVTVSYGNLTLSGSNAKTVSNALTILNNFSLTGGTFTGGSFTHTVKGNWTMTSGTFTNTGTTILFNGTAGQTIKSTGAFNAVTINKASGSVYDSTDVTVNGTLTLTSGNIITGSSKQIMGASGGISRTSGHIIGNLQKNVATGATSRTFEIGDASGYTPVSVTFGNVSVAGDLTVSTLSGDHSDIANSQLSSSLSVNRNWTLTGSGITFNNYSITLNFLAGDVDGGATTGNFYVSKKSAGTWLVPAVGTRTSASTQATGVTTFGDFAIGELSARVWDGGASTFNWGDANNWAPDAVPSASEEVWIKSGVTVLINSAVSIGGLLLDHPSAVVLLQTGGSLTVNNTLTLTNGEIQINGQSLTLNGTLASSGSGTIRGDASSSLTVGGSTGGDFGTLRMTASSPNNKLLNFTLNRTGSSASAAIGSNGLEVGGVVTLTNGTLNTGGNLTLLSSTDGTARLAAINEANAAISGNVTVQRYVPAVTRRSRMLSAPVGNFSFSQYIDDMFISGPGGAANGFDASPSNSSTIYTFQESTGGTGRGWKSLSNISNTLDAGMGSLVFIRGDRTIGTPDWYTSPFPLQNEVTIDYTSQPVNVGTVSPTITYSSTGVPADDGWNLVGNPYPSQIDWNNVGRSNVSPFFYSLNPVTGSYIADDGTNLIASGQGFFVQALGASPSITFTESSKAASAPTNYFKTGNTIVTANMIKDSLNSDLLRIVFATGASLGYDPLEDAIKLLNPTINFASLVDSNVMLQYNKRPHLTAVSDTVRLYADAQAGAYTLTFDGIANVDLNYSVSLYDSFTSTTQDLRINATYAFTITSNPLSKGSGRFMLIFHNPNALPVTLAGFDGERADDDVYLLWQTTNEKNNSHFIVERSDDNLHFEKIGVVNGKGNSSVINTYSFSDHEVFAIHNSTNAFYYRLTQVDKNGAESYSRVITIRRQEFVAKNETISLYPNPVKNNLSFKSNLQEGTEVHILVIDAMNKACMQGVSRQQNDKVMLDVSELGTGVYMIRFSTDGGTPAVLKFVKE